MRREGEFIVGGIAKAEGGRFGGIHVGRWTERGLAYAGLVEYGFRRETLTELPTRSREIVQTTSPFADTPRRVRAIWLEPRLTAALTYAELVNGTLRDPVFRRFQDVHVTRTSPAAAPTG